MCEMGRWEGMRDQIFSRSVEVWKPPTQGFVKVNVDDMFSGVCLACGGIARNKKGEALWGFMFKDHFENSIAAEAMGCYGV